MGRSGLSLDEQNNSAELRDIFSHLVYWINCLWNALAALDSESHFISFQMNWDWCGSWHLLLCTWKKGGNFSFLLANLGNLIGKIKAELCVSVWGPGHTASEERLVFWISMVSDMIQVIVIHQICFQLPLSPVVFSLLGWLGGGLMTQWSCHISFCWWLSTLPEFFAS